MTHQYDAVVIGSGPNGLLAAVEIAGAGRSVLVLEAADRPGGGTRTEEVTLPGFRHDVCSTIHPLGLASPALRSLPLAEHGVEWIQPDAPLAHPLDGRAAILERSLADTATRLGADGARWRRLLGLVAGPGTDLTDQLLDPFALPRHPLALARYGMTGIRGAESVVGRFDGDEAAALLAGLAGHAIQRLDAPTTAGFGLLLGGLAHTVGWPLARGGSQSIADALVSILESRGGEVECGRLVTTLDDLPPSRVVLADTSPGAVVSMLGDRLPGRWRRRVGRFRHGPGVFKVDWALDGPVPWSDPEVARAATVHVGGTAAEVIAAEHAVATGQHPERPFVLVAQTSLFDPSRAPTGQHTLWGYCHVPNGSTVDMTDRIERQIERFAPGFRDRILARRTMDTVAVEAHDANYVGGDINGGAADIRQFVFRPVVAARPWIVPADGWYLCSSSVPPGGGVHGMCGRLAARSALARELR
ncbi:MAG TPA: NAD(P)/FAD-dependent oxidoreductase [Ilumatobacter sp.]